MAVVSKVMADYMITTGLTSWTIPRRAWMEHPQPADMHPTGAPRHTTSTRAATAHRDMRDR